MRRTRFIFSLLLAGLFASGHLFANDSHDHEHDHPDLPPKSNQVKFVQNQNQWREAVRYRADLPGGWLFLENSTFTYAFWDTENLHDRFFHSQNERNALELAIDCHAFKVGFEGANTEPTLLPLNKATEYHNYFIGDNPDKWASEVPLFGGIRYHELYPGIDLQVWGKEGTVKYEFEVMPEVDPALIQMKYDGADAVYVKDGELHIETSVNHIVEASPFAYQVLGGHKVPIPCNFVVEGKTVSFELPESYDKTLPLVIDPTLIFSTYTGSFADNFGYTATYDTSGALYGGGIAFGVVGNYPTTTGAYQTTFGGGGTGAPWAISGGIDISISKFDPTGANLVYSTYLGGSENEQPHSLITNDAGELFVLGTSYSTNYPTSSTAYDNTQNGGADIVVTRFNAAGSNLLGSTFVGGNSNDGLNSSTGFARVGLKYNYGDEARGEIMLDDQSNIYIASCTWSNNFPTTAGAYQTTFGGGTQDGCVFLLSPDCSTLQWSTLLGGSNYDAAYSLKVRGNGKVYVTGGTLSNNYPTTTGTIQPAYAGAIDGFVSVLNPTGTGLIASTYLGTAAYDQSYFLQLDADGDVYVVGQSLGGWPVSAGVYSEANGKQFIQKMDSSLSNVVFSTVFGSGGSDIDISPTAFLVDVCEYIYVSGWGGTVNFGGSTNNLTVTPDAYKDSTDGSDIYIFILERDAIALEYATYFGGDTASEHVDGGTSRFNKDLEIYQAVCAGCGGRDDFPYTPGAWSQTNNAANNNCNLGVFKMAFTPQNVAADFSASVQSGCAPFQATFDNNSTGGVFFVWEYGDGTPNDTTLTPVPVNHQYDTAGTYLIRLIAADSNSCNVADTHVTSLTVYDVPLASVSGGGSTCNSSPVQLSAAGGDHYQWIPATYLSDDTISNPVATPPVTTTYTVIVTNNGGCSDTAQVTVTVSNISSDAGPPASFCEGTAGVQLTASTVNGQAPFYYQWWCDTTGGNNCGIDSTFDDDPLVLPSRSSWYYLQITDANGCQSDIDSVWVEVLPVPVVDAGPDVWVCPPPSPGIQLNPSISNAPGPYTYQWLNGSTLNDSTIFNPMARPDTTTIYTLVVTSSNGCTSQPTTLDTLSTITVNVYPLPVAEAGPDLDLCFGDSLRLQGFGFNAGPNYRFEWTPGNVLEDPAYQNPLAWPSLTTEFVLVTYSNGCPSYGDTVTVNVHTLPTVDAGNTIDLCLGESDQLNATAWGDSTATSYSFAWSPALGLDDDSIPTPNASPPNSQVYYVNATSNFGCTSATDSVLVQVVPTPQAEAGPPVTLCANNPQTLLGGYYYTTTDSASDPSQIYYYWSPQTGLSNPTVAQPQVSVANGGWYYLQVNHLQCQTIDSVLVTVIPDLGIQVAADTQLICAGDSVQLYGSGGIGSANFQWTPRASLTSDNIPEPVAGPGSTTTYQLVLSELGCLDTAEVTIEVLPTPEASYISSQRSGCVPFPVNFLETTSDGILYAWNFGDGSPIQNGANPTHIFDQPGTFDVTLIATAVGGCLDTSQAQTITVIDTAHADFTTDPAFPVELTFPATQVNFTDLTVNGMDWLWDFGDGGASTMQNPSHTYTDAGEFFVTLTVDNGDGCLGRVTKGPFVINSPEVFIPNVFTPNGDGVSEVFMVDYTGDQPFKMEIFDRWGVKQYESTNKTKGWNGLSTMGSMAQPGVYFVTVRIGPKEYAGTVTLIR